MDEDIIERLRDTTGIHEQLIYEAADEIERYRKNQGILITSFRINMLRLCPDYSREEFDKDIAAMLGEKDHDVPVKNARVEPAKHSESNWDEHSSPGDDYLGGDYYEWDNR